MKNPFKHITAMVVAALMVAAMASCEDYKGKPEEFDTPVLRYQVKGVILDEDGNQLSGLKVTLKEGPYYYGKVFVGRDSVVTDREGLFVTSVMEDVAISSFQKLIVVDKKGRYESDTISLEKLPKMKVEKRSGALWGTYLLTANRVLKRKK